MMPASSHGTAFAGIGMLEFARCLGAQPRSEVYVSTPITSGSAFVRWRLGAGAQLDRSDPNYASEHRLHVIEKNIAKTAPLVSHLREQLSPRLVIDPTALPDQDGWTQRDYHSFWCEVVATYAHSVVFADDWQYSNGCVAEFSTAVSVNAHLFDSNLNNLSVAEGRSMVREAIAELESASEDTASLRQSLAVLLSER